MKIKFSGISPENRPYIAKPIPSKKLKAITSIVNNHILPHELSDELNYNHLSALIYCSANTIATLTNKTQKPSMSKPYNTPTRRTKINNPTSKQQTHLKPRWQFRLQGKIDQYRRDLGVITSHISGKTGKRCKNKLNHIKRKYIVHTQFEPRNSSIEQIRDTIKQRLLKYRTRLRSYMKSYQRSKQTVSK